MSRDEGRVEVLHIGRHRYRSGEIAFDERSTRSHVLRQPVGAGEEVPVWVGGQHRDVEHVRIGEQQAELLARLCLYVCPGADAAFSVCSDRAAEKPAGRDRAVISVAEHAIRPRHSVVLAKEHLVRRVRGVGLALVDPWRVGVGGVLDIVRSSHGSVRTRLVLRACEDHECLARWDLVTSVRFAIRPDGAQRVVSLQRDEHSGAALHGLVNAVVKELPKDRKQGVVWRREPEVRRDIRDGQRLASWNAAGGDTRCRAGDDAVCTQAAGWQTRGHDSGRVGHGLVDDQVADDAWLRVDDIASLLAVARRTQWADRQGSSNRLSVTEHRRRQPRKELVG